MSSKKWNPSEIVSLCDGSDDDGGSKECAVVEHDKEAEIGPNLLVGSDTSSFCEGIGMVCCVLWGRCCGCMWSYVGGRGCKLTA